VGGAGQQESPLRTRGVVPEPDQNLNNLIDSIKISLDFSETPLPEVVSFISEVSQVSVVVERRQIEDPDTTGLTFKVQDATLRDALTSALDSVGLGFYVQNGLLVVTTKEEIARLDKRRAEFEEQRALAVKEEAEILDRWVTLTGENLAIREVADLLSKATGIGYVIDTPTWNRAARLSFDGEPHTLREIFAAMASGAPVRVAYREGRLWFLDRPAPQEAK
jgi:type II secretory pathway component GspD/PulD (secretin)